MVQLAGKLLSCESYEQNPMDIIFTQVWKANQIFQFIFCYFAVTCKILSFIIQWSNNGDFLLIGVTSAALRVEPFL